VSAVVADADTAISAGSGDVPVLATPGCWPWRRRPRWRRSRRIWLPGMTSVGTSASLEHRRASPVGAEVVVEAELTEVDGRRLMFSFIAREGGQDGDEDLVVGAGTVERVLVDRAVFLARTASHPR
jgi:predicted thioesterase